MRRDSHWVKSRIAARIILRSINRTLTPRDVRLARTLHRDRGVTDRLVDQALASICAQKGLCYEQVLSQATLVS